MHTNAIVEFAVVHQHQPGMQILIKTLTGRQQQFNFEPSSKVSEVKNALQEKECVLISIHDYPAPMRTDEGLRCRGIANDQIRLIFGGKQMADEKSLEDYGVQPGSVIHMVLQLRGGGAP